MKKGEPSKRGGRVRLQDKWEKTSPKKGKKLIVIILPEKLHGGLPHVFGEAERKNTAPRKTTPLVGGTFSTQYRVGEKLTKSRQKEPQGSIRK